MIKQTRQLQQLVESALKTHRSIRGIGVVDIKGVQIYFKLRKGLKPLLTEIENEEYASNAIERHRNRIKFDGATGGLDYAIVRYKNVIRGIVPISQELYLLMAFDTELVEFDEIVTKKLIPLIKRYAAGL
jgi:hypothetical protein